MPADTAKLGCDVTSCASGANLVIPTDRSPARSYGDDGFVVRKNGDWALQKLQFLEEFGPVALKATGTKLTRVYVDLFAGPGINQPSTSQSPFQGSPLRALSLHSGDGQSFTDAYLINNDPLDHAALVARVDAAITSGHSRLPRARVRVWEGDANKRVTEILDAIHPKAYVFVFADPANPSQLPWRTIELLKTRRHHESMDLYTLFPYEMALSRMAGYNGEATEANARALTTFYGDESWRPCMVHRESSALSKDFARCMLDAYLQRLRSLWGHAYAVREVRIGNRGLYKMLFATSNGAGHKIAKWAKQKNDRNTGQISML